MTTVALQQVSSAFARRNAAATLEKPVHLKYLASALKPDQLAAIREKCTGDAVFVWGSKFERLPHWAKAFPKDCLFLFRRGKQVFKCAVLVDRFYSDEVGDRLWGADADGETWSLIYVFGRTRKLSIPAAEINALLDRSPEDNWQGLNVVTSTKLSAVVDRVKESAGLRSNDEPGLARDG